MIFDEFTYDAAGNVTAKQIGSSLSEIIFKNGFDVITNIPPPTPDVYYFNYDANNRPTAIDYPGTDLDVSFIYDQGTNGLNQLTSFADSHSTTTLTYDAFGNLTGKTQTVNNINGSNIALNLTYAYDANNRLQSITYPSGTVVTYQYNTLNQITQVSSNSNGQITTLLSNITYLPMGPLSSMTLGNGLNYSSSYDNGYRLNAYQYGNTLSGSYSYDNNHNINSISRETASNDTAYLYDNLDRIAQETALLTNYSYDKLGNRTSQSIDTQAPINYSYDSNSNRLQQIDSQTRNYDQKGNTLSDGNNTYTYNQAQRMASASQNSTLKAEYFYNPIGQRIRKTNTTDNTEHLYLYNANGQLLNESIYDTNGTLIQSKDTIWLGNKPIAQIRTIGASSTVYYILNDHLNTPRKVTNATGTVLWSWNSDAFGSTPANQDVDGNGTDFEFNLRFPGQYFDKETGQHYNYFRDYEPGTGRYLESDPIGLRGGFNTYSYSNYNPISFYDASGLYYIVVCTGSESTQEVRNPYTGQSFGGNRICSGRIIKWLPDYNKIGRCEGKCRKGLNFCKFISDVPIVELYNNLFIPYKIGLIYFLLSSSSPLPNILPVTDDGFRKGCPIAFSNCMAKCTDCEPDDLNKSRTDSSSYY